MGGIDTPREREKIEYRPRLRYELPPAVEAATVEAESFLSDPVALVQQVGRFSVSAAIASVEALIKGIQLPPGGDSEFLSAAGELFSEVRESLAVARYLLESQKKWLSDEEKEREEWLSLLAAAEDAKRRLQQAADAVPWEVLTYPEEHPDRQQDVHRYLTAEREYLSLSLEASEATRFHFTVADIVHVVERHVDGVELLVQLFQEPLDVPLVELSERLFDVQGSESVGGVPVFDSEPTESAFSSSAKRLVEWRIARLKRDRSKLKALLRLVDAKAQKLAVDRLLELEALKLEANSVVRRAMHVANEGEDAAFDEAAEKLVSIVLDVDESYKIALFDVHRVFELFRELVKKQLDLLREEVFLRRLA